MAHISLSDAQAWLENTKANLAQIDLALEAQVSAETLGQMAETFNDSTVGVPTWVDQNTTPEIVKQIIAMRYAGWYYDRQYSEVLASEGTSYGMILRQNADTIIEGILGGSIIVSELGSSGGTMAPVFYPNDVSSTHEAQALNRDPDDMSKGPALFGTAQVF